MTASTRASATLLFVATLGTAWWGGLDRYATERTHAALERALVTFALARTLNGAISVAQGTELAFQPAGVGVVISAGQVLDPLNDLVEQFSSLTLVAATSLGIQALLGELFASRAANFALTTVIVLALLALWAPLDAPLRSPALRIAAAVIFVRFAIALAALGTAAVNELYLTQREATSIAALTQTQATMESTREVAAPAAPSTDSLLERLNRFLDDQRQALDIESRLARLKDDVEAAVRHVVDLIVIYVVETLLLPLAFLAAAWQLVKLAWRRIV